MQISELMAVVSGWGHPKLRNQSKMTAMATRHKIKATSEPKMIFKTFLLAKINFNNILTIFLKMI